MLIPAFARKWVEQGNDRWEALSPNGRGAVLVIVGSAGFSVMAALVKHLGQSLDSFQIAFFRCVFGLMVLMPLLMRMGIGELKTGVPHLHGLRALFGVTAMMSGFYAFTHLPLATATAVTFTKPFFMIILAVIFLGEIVRWRRGLATAVGFIGVLVILRPGVGDFDPAMLVAVLQALAISCTVVVIKHMPKQESTFALVFYFAAISTVVSAVPAALVWQWPSGPQWIVAMLIGLIGVTSQSMVVQGFRLGEATVLSPLDYSRLLFAVLFGLVFFAETPDPFVFLGAGIIIASTVYIARREAKLGVGPRTGPAPH